MLKSFKINVLGDKKAALRLGICAPASFGIITAAASQIKDVGETTIVPAYVNGDGIEWDAGDGIKCPVQRIEMKEIVGLLADRDRSYLLAQNTETQSGCAQHIEDGLLCSVVDSLCGGTVCTHLYHLTASVGAHHISNGGDYGLGRNVA